MGEYTGELKEIEDAIASLRQQISASDDYVQCCEKYLALGKERIADLLMTQYYKGVGIEQPVDPEVAALRKAAYGAQAMAGNAESPR